MSEPLIEPVETPAPRAQPPRVAHLIDSLDVSGGAERQLVANLRAFDHDLIRHDIVLLKSAAVSRAADIPDEVNIWLLGEDKQPMSRFQATLALYRLVRRERFDLLHASLPDSALAARLVGLATGTPVVESLVNISHEEVRIVDNPGVTMAKLRLHRWLDRLTMFRVRRFHAVSNAVADSWADTVKISPRRIDVIPRGIDRGQFGVGDEERRAHRASVLEEFRLPDDTFLVIAVGRQEPQKGHRYLLEAAHRLREGVPSLRILIVGRTGLASGRLNKLIEDLGIGDIVTLTGSRTDLPRLLAASDVFAFPSLFEGNGGNAMIEAMAIGLPIVTTGVPPMTDLVPNDEFGLLVPRTDSEALADALARLAADPALRQRLGAAAGERAAGFATPEESARRYEAWYREILDVG